MIVSLTRAPAICRQFRWCRWAETVGVTGATAWHGVMGGRRSRRLGPAGEGKAERMVVSGCCLAGTGGVLTRLAFDWSCLGAAAVGRVAPLSTPSVRHAVVRARLG